MLFLSATLLVITTFVFKWKRNNSRKAEGYAEDLPWHKPMEYLPQKGN